MNTLSDLFLLPDSDPMLAQRLDEFDFEAKIDSLAIRDLLVGAMAKFGGIGIAANQVGLPHRAFAMMRFGYPMVFFNPVISELSQETIMMEEGCLTFPDLWLKISRPSNCNLIYHDPHGHRHSVELSGMECRVALHEIDHLNGIVMTKKVSRTKLDMAKKRKSKKNA